MRKFYSLILLLLFIAASTYGQIFFTAKLGGSQENPAVTTTASGTGTFVLSAGGTQLSYHVTVNGLSGAITGSHFHNGPVGTNAGGEDYPLDKQHRDRDRDMDKCLDLPA